MDEHEVDLNIEQMMEELRFKMYEIDTIKDSIVAQQRAIIETLKGRLGEKSNEEDKFLQDKTTFAKDKHDLEVAQANFQIEKEYYQHLIDQANEKAASEKQRASALASALYKLKLEMAQSIQSLDTCLDKDVEDAISSLHRVRAELEPYGGCAECAYGV
jgi:hypothetical protein